MLKWTKEFRRRVTTNCNAAVKSLNEADLLCNEQPQPQLQNNLGNKIADLQARKATLAGLEGELRQHLQDEGTLSEEEKNDLEADLLRHMDNGGQKRLQGEIDTFITRMEQLAAQISVASLTCSGAGLQNTGAENGSPSLADATAPGNTGPSGEATRTLAQIIPQLQDVVPQAPTRDIVQQEDTQAWRARVERTQRDTSTEINMMKDVLGDVSRSSQLMVEQMKRLEAQLASNSSRTAGQQGPQVNQADCISQGDLNSGARLFNNRPSDLPSTSTQYRSYESGVNTNLNSRSNSTRFIDNAYGFNNNSQAVVQRDRWEGNRQLIGYEREQRYEEMKWEKTRAAVVSSIMASVQAFSGDPLDYPAFISRFESMTSRNILVDAEAKQVILLALLPEELRREYQTPELSEEKYRLIRQNLDRQFNRPIAQKARMFKELNELVFPNRDDTKLISALNKVSSLVSTLQHFGVHDDDAFLISTIVNRLPNRLKSAANKVIESGRVTIDKVLDAVHRAISVQTGTWSQEPEQIPGYDEAYTNHMQFNAVQNGYGRNTRNPKQGGRFVPRFTPPCKQMPCAYCSDPNHAATTCQLSPEMKREAVKQKKMCYNCLSRKHTVTDCQSKFNCFHCQGRHFTGHCPVARTVNNIQFHSIDAFVQWEDDEDLELQLFRGPGAETPEF